MSARQRGRKAGTRTKGAARPGAAERSDVAMAGLLLVAAKVGIVPLFFDASAMVAFQIPKANVAQILGTLLLGALVGVLVAEGRRAFRITPLHAPVVALGAIYVAAALGALDPVIALRGAVDRGLGLFALLDGIVLFVAVPAFVRTRRDAMIVGGAFFGAAIPILAYELVQAADLDPIPWQGAEGGRDRQISTLGNATVLGQYLASIAAAAVALALLRFDGMSRRIRLGLLAIGVAALVGTLGTGTRATVVGLLAASAVGALAFALRARPSLARIAPLALAAVLSIGIAAVVLTPLGDRAGDLIAAAAQRDGSIRARLLLYDVAIRVTGDHPVLGVGPDNYTAAFPGYRPPDAHRILSGSALETSTHSWVLYHATSAGLLGLAAFTVACAVGFVMALRPGSPSVGVAAAVVLAQFLGTGLLTVNDPGTEWLPWLALGAIAATYPTAAVGEVRSQRRSVARSRWSLVAIAVAALLTLPVWQWMDAARWAEQSQRDTDAGRLDSALVAAQNAVSADPQRAEYWNEVGRAHAGRERFRDAERAFQRAADLAPYQSVILSNLSRAQVGIGIQGDREAYARAYDTAKRAVASDPNTAYVHYALALAAAQTGRVEEAIDESERGWAIDRPTGQPFAYEVAVRLYLSLGRIEDAHRWADAGVESEPNVFLYTAQGRILLALGDSERALELAELALELEPGNADAQALRAEALRRLGR